MQTPILDMWKSLTLTARAAVLILVVPLVVILWSVAPVVSTLAKLTVSIDESGAHGVGEEAVSEGSEEIDQAYLDYDQHLDAYRNLITSRSAFYLPMKSSPNEPGDSHDGPSMGGSQPPYGGPRLIGLVGNFAYFDETFSHDHNYLKVGEGDGDTKFVRVVGPRVALIRWRRWEYERIVLGEMPLSLSAGEVTSSTRSEIPDRSRSREVDRGEFLFGEPSKGGGLFGEGDGELDLESGGQLFIPVEKKKDSESDSSESK